MLQLRKVYLVTPFVCQTRQLSFSRAGVTLRKSTGNTVVCQLKELVLSCSIQSEIEIIFDILDNTQRWLSANRIIAQSQDGDDYRRNRYRHNKV